jgi:hypothetical protein
VKVAPVLMLVVPIEGDVRALFVSESLEDEQRLALDLRTRRLLDELVDALCDLLEDRDPEATS